MLVHTLQVFVLLVASIAGPPGTPAHTRAIQHAPVIWEEAQMVGEDPMLTAVQCRVETQFDPQAIGRHGERGMMQVLPKIWRTQCPDLLPHVNEAWAQIRCGLRSVKAWKAACHSKKPEGWLGGYNGGYSACGKRTKYVRKVLSVKVKKKVYNRIILES